jgi:hypothetical protein
MWAVYTGAESAGSEGFVYSTPGGEPDERASIRLTSMWPVTTAIVAKQRVFGIVQRSSKQDE